MRLAPLHLTAADAARLWSYVVKGRGRNACWEWTGGRDRGGYGRFKLGGRTVKAHRAVASLTQDVGDKVVRHSCDNPPCCRPSHLLVGSYADNTADAVQRGRHRGNVREALNANPEAIPRGETHYRSFLTNDAVRALRERVAAGESQAAIATELGLSVSVVSAAATGRTFRDAGGPIRTRRSK